MTGFTQFFPAYGAVARDSTGVLVWYSGREERVHRADRHWQRLHDAPHELLRCAEALTELFSP